MNNREVKEILSENGFNKKEIGVIRKYSNEDNVAYVTILSGLRKRFLGACVIVIILLALLVNVMLTGDKGDLESYLFAMVVSLAITFFLTPFPLAWKVFSLLRKYPYLLS